MAPGQAGGLCTKYRTFVTSPPSRVSSSGGGILALNFKTSFHFPPNHVTRDLERRKAKTKQTGRSMKIE